MPLAWMHVNTFHVLKIKTPNLNPVTHLRVNDKSNDSDVPNASGSCLNKPSGVYSEISDMILPSGCVDLLGLMGTWMTSQSDSDFSAPHWL